MTFRTDGYAPSMEGVPTDDSTTQEVIDYVRDTLQNGSNPTRGNFAFAMLVARLNRVGNELRDKRDGLTINIAWLSGIEAELWEKRDDPYFLGKHDGVNSALHRLKQLRESASKDGES